jgi:hypothetical protein
MCTGSRVHVPGPGGSNVNGEAPAFVIFHPPSCRAAHRAAIAEKSHTGPSASQGARRLYARLGRFVGDCVGTQSGEQAADGREITVAEAGAELLVERDDSGAQAREPRLTGGRECDDLRAPVAGDAFTLHETVGFHPIEVVGQRRTFDADGRGVSFGDRGGNNLELLTRSRPLP